MKKYTYVLLLMALLLMAPVPGFAKGAEGAAVNINVASAQELSESLNGIGLKKAQAIVNYRQKNGKFANVKDLLKIKGIGPKILLKNEALIRVDSNK